MVSIENLIPSEGRELFAEFIFKYLDVNSGLKRKSDLIVKNSTKKPAGANKNQI